MRFSEAVEKLVSGEAVRREGWFEDQSIQIAEDLGYPPGEQRYVIQHTTHGGTSSYRGRQFEYHPSVDDLVSDDWVLYRGPRPMSISEVAWDAEIYLKSQNGFTMKLRKTPARAAREIATRYGMIDGEHHKQWVIDQMLRAILTEEEYGQFRAEMDNDPDYDPWDVGIPP